MTGQIIAGFNAAQFTNDNKSFYAYSGVVTCAGGASNFNTLTDMLQFTTNSEYLKIIVSWANTQTSGTADNFVAIKFNNVSVYQFRAKEGGESNHTNPKNLVLIVPPFTTALFEADTSADPHEWTFTVTGKVGMPPRVGN